jgi:hypothetical protein
MEAGQFRGKEGLSVRILYCIFRQVTHTSLAYTGRVINPRFMLFVVKDLPFGVKTAPPIFAICGDSRARPYWLGKTRVQAMVGVSRKPLYQVSTDYYCQYK